MNALESRLRLFSLPGFLLLWEVSARVGWIDVRFFPAVSTISYKFVLALGSGELVGATLVSMFRVVAGFAVGAAAGLFIGLVMGTSRYTTAALEPLVNAIYPLPKSALMPLALLFFGIGEASKVFIIAVSVFFPVLFNTVGGVLNIRPVYKEVGKIFKASRRNFFFRIALPGALPSIMTGLRLGWGLALILIVIAEFSGAKSGLGYMIWNSWQVFDVARLYIGLFTIGLIGLLTAKVFDYLEVVLVPWNVKRVIG